MTGPRPTTHPGDQLLERIASLNVYKRGDRRAPHKPLLLLVAISRLTSACQTRLPFDEVRERLHPLLAAWAPPVRGRHQPQLPYWHLQTDGLWEIPGAEGLERQRSGFPRMAALHQTAGGLPTEMAEALLASPVLVERVVRHLLDAHFPESVHADILESIGLDLEAAGSALLAAEALPGPNTRRRRDPDFRRTVLRAYEHRCAVSGFRAALGASYFGVEAAHVRWFSHGGPGSVDNGLVLTPTLHVLFDRGAWTLTDDRRVLVSAEFTGTDEAVGMLRGLHARPLREPLPGCPRVSVDFIRWHRDANRGGVFRGPALPL